LAKKVVAQVHNEVIIAQKFASNKDTVSQPQGRFLRDVRDVHPPTTSIPYGCAYLRTGVTRNYADLGDSSLDHVLNPIKQNRLIRDGYELLCTGMGYWPKPRAGAAGKYETLHTNLSSSCGRRQQKATSPI
jgi:hypothetical protein